MSLNVMNESIEKITNFIGGEERPPLVDDYLNNINPSRGAVYALTPNSSAKDVELAFAAAQSAYKSWSKTSVSERSNYLRKIAALIRKNSQALAKVEALDSGKPIGLATNLDIPRSEQNLDFFASQLQTFDGETFATDDRALNNVVYSPLGVVGCISPWNLPLYLFTWKIAPALAAGNTVVAKPSEVTPMTAYWFGKLAQEAGLPPGVLNIVHGTGAVAGAALVSSPVKAVSFTGSTTTGRSIARATAGDFKKLSLEMGGKNANIIFSDCDFEKAVEATVKSSFLNQGQICLCGSRVFVQEEIYEKFKSSLIEKTKLLKSGDPLDFATEQGALVSQEQLLKVEKYVALARAEGGVILCGGEKPMLPKELMAGYYYLPTLIEGLDARSAVNQDEIFGPVATLTPFKTAEEVVHLANSSRYGLSASVWCKNINQANFVARELEVGTVWINSWMLRDLRAPFGGVKESGVGREGGLYGLRFFSEVKNICTGLS